MNIKDVKGQIVRGKRLCKCSGMKWLYPKRKILDKPSIQIEYWIKFIEKNQKQIQNNIEEGAIGTLDFYLEAPVLMHFQPNELKILSENKIEIDFTDYG